jgi:hypothetical protein
MGPDTRRAAQLVLDKPFCPAQSQIHEKGPAVPALRDTGQCYWENMSVIRKFRFHLAFAAGCIVLSVILNWFILSESSPLRSYFLYHVGIPNLWSRLHIIPYITGMIVSGNIDRPDWTVSFITACLQWFVVGFLLSFVFTGFRVRQ